MEWPHVITTQRLGKLDEVLEIRAAAGYVELKFPEDSSGVGMLIRIPAEAISELVRRLETARDAAALMASQ